MTDGGLRAKSFNVFNWEYSAGNYAISRGFESSWGHGRFSVLTENGDRMKNGMILQTESQSFILP